jgi:subtilisin family serine protease
MRFIRRLSNQAFPKTSSRYNTRLPLRRKLAAFERLEERRVLTGATAVMLGQEFTMPSWLSPEQVTLAQQAAAAITDENDTPPIYTSTAQSYPPINATEYFSDPSYSRFDGSGYSIAILDTGADLDHPAFGPDLNSDGIGDRIAYQQDFADNDFDASDVNGHGTNVASIAAGIASGANIIILKVFGHGLSQS